MTIFVLSVATVLVVSAICSLTEASFYAVRTPYIRQLAESGSRAGQALAVFKENMERPISAILIINTAANTAGAAVAGSQAQILFGNTSVVWFSLCFTVAVLFFSEIMPKVIGVVYSRPVATWMALPWAVAIRLLSPLIWFIQHLSQLLKPREPVLAAPEEEVQQMAMISAEEGSIMPYEAELVRNVLRLDKVTTRDVMTPRPVVFKLSSDMTLREVADTVKEWTYSRIPVYKADDPETWEGVVFSREVLSHLAADQFDTKLGSLCTPIYFVSEKTAGHILLETFLKRRTHLFGVMDEYGDITGIVTLEDVLESMLGKEIVDEADTVVDMQEVARRRKEKHFGKQKQDDARPNQDRSG